MFAPSAERVNDLRQQQFLSVAALLGVRRTTPGLLTFVQTVRQVTERRPAGTMCDSNGGS